LTEPIGRVLTTDEEDALLKACAKSHSSALHPFVALGITTGMRYSEIRLLKWEQVDLIGATLTVGASKTDAGTGRKVPLNTRALKALQTWATQFPDRKPHHHLFPTEGIGLATDDAVVVAHHTKPTVPIESEQHAWQRAKKAAGVPIRFHDLRHSACTRLLEAGVPLMVAGQLLGWARGTVALMAAKYAATSGRRPCRTP
jgi:integrase